MASARRAARLAAAAGPVPVVLAPSADWRDYWDEREQPPPYWSTEAEDVWMWRRVRAQRRLLAAQRAWRADQGSGGC